MNRKTIVVAWILQLAVAAILSASAIGKLVGAPEAVALFVDLGMEPTGRYLVAVLELVAALLLLLPWSVAWGGVLAWGLMSGALIAHATRLGISGEMGILSLAAFFNWAAASVILYLRRSEIEFIRSMFERKQE